MAHRALGCWAVGRAGPEEKSLRELRRRKLWGLSLMREQDCCGDERGPVRPDRKTMAQESLRSDTERDMEVSGGSSSQSFWRPKASPSSG